MAVMNIVGVNIKVEVQIPEYMIRNLIKYCLDAQESPEIKKMSARIEFPSNSQVASERSLLDKKARTLERWTRISQYIHDGLKPQDAARKVFGYPVKKEEVKRRLQKLQLITPPIQVISKGYKTQDAKGEKVPYGTVMARGG